MIGSDPYVDRNLAGESGITLKSLPEVMRESDYVSLHPCLNQETFHLIGEKELALMKPSAYLINTSRGSVVDEPALIRALRTEGSPAPASMSLRRIRSTRTTPC